MIIVTKSSQRAQNELTDYLNPLLKGVGSKSLTLHFGSIEYRGYLKLESARNKAQEAVRIVPQSFLVSMVSQYDAFLATSLKNLFLLKPEKIKSADRSVSVKDLVRFTTIDEVLQELIETEIDEVLRESHLKQLQWISKKFDFSIDTKDQLVQRFIEVTERRNLFVHTEGIVSKQYIERISDLDKEIAHPCTLGSNLRCNRAYMENARNTLFEIAIRTTQIAWRKLRPDQSEAQDRFLITVIFELLARDDFSLARNISDFAASIRGVAKEASRLTLCVNRAQAYKWSGKNERAKAIINEIDWSASSANFRLAAAVINDDVENAILLIKQVPIEGNEGITADGYRLWPLFREIRLNEKFQAAFETKFGEPLLRKSVDISAENAKTGLNEENNFEDPNTDTTQ